jgi:hypothetical protein
MGKKRRATAIYETSCGGYFVHPFVKWMELLLIASFFLSCSFHKGRDTRAFLVSLRPSCRSIDCSSSLSVGDDKEAGPFKHVKNTAMSWSVL